jgi:3-hydroxybutyryl-CoA dehydrogenase
MAIKIRSVAVVGSGTMGQGIAMAALMGNYTVMLYDVNPTTLSKAQHNIEKFLEGLVTRNKLDESAARLQLSRLKLITRVEEISADLVIEAIVEKLEVKQTLFRQLKNTAIIASNTSSLSIDAIAQGVDDPSKIAGLHFFNPAQLMRLVEVVRGHDTSSEVLSALVAFVESIGKVPVLTKDSPGFIVNRVARHFYTESFYLLAKGMIGPRGMDSLMRSAGFKMGPCELSDLIGHDVNYAVTESLYESFNRASRFTPSPIQKELVEKNHLGRKANKGFYEYPAA